MTVQDLISKHEGLRLFPYADTVGKLTIGFGRNLTDIGISRDEADALLTNDLDRARTGIAEAWPPFSQLRTKSDKRSSRTWPSTWAWRTCWPSTTR